MNIVIPQPHELVTLCIYFSTTKETVRFSKTLTWEKWGPTFQKIPDLEQWIQHTTKEEAPELRELVIGELTIDVSIQGSHRIVSPCRMRFEMNKNYTPYEDHLICDGWREIRPEEVRQHRTYKQKVA